MRLRFSAPVLREVARRIIITCWPQSFKISCDFLWKAAGGALVPCLQQTTRVMTASGGGLAELRFAELRAYAAQRHDAGEKASSRPYSEFTLSTRSRECGSLIGRRRIDGRASLFVTGCSSNNRQRCGKSGAAIRCGPNQRLFGIRARNRVVV